MNTLPDSIDWIPIDSVLPDGQADCACLAVAHPSRCYVTESGIVTHNSDTAGAVDRLPDNPRRLLDHILAGHTLEEAARAGDLPQERAPEVMRNIGRVLANDWHARGVDQEAATRELQQRVMDGLGAAPKSADSIFYNHIDKAVTRQAEVLARGIAASGAGQAFGRALTKLADVGDRYVPFFEAARHTLTRQAVPMHFIPSEAKALLREMQIKTAFGKQLAMDVYRSMTGQSKFTDIAYPPGFSDNPAEKKRLYLAMTGEIPLDTLPAAHQRLAAQLRSLLADAGEEAVRTGRMSAETLANLRENYLPHYYEDDLKQNNFASRAKRILGLRDVLAQRSTAWHIVDTERKDPLSPDQDALVTWDDRGRRWRFNSQEHRDAFFEQFLKERTLADIQDGRDLTDRLAALAPDRKREVRAELRGITLDDIDKREKLSDEARGVIRQTMNRVRQRYLKRSPHSVEQHERAGLIFDPVYSTVRYLAQMTHDNAVAGLFNAIADNPGWSSDSAAAGFKQIPDARSYGRLAGKWVAAPIADQVTAVAGQESPAMEIYDDLMRAWSSGKTVWNPGTHVRNFLGNLLFSSLSGTSAHNPLNWKYYRAGMKAIRDGGAQLEEMYQHGVLGGDYSSQELRGALRELLPDPSLMGEDEPPTRIMARVGRALFGKLPEMLKRTGSKIGATAHGVYKVTDDFFKAAGYLKAREMGMTPEQAAAETRKWYPYYDHIGSSSAIKFARRIHPFLSFAIESARILKNAAAERPLGLAASMIVPYVITQAAMNMLGLAKGDQDEVLRDMRGKLKFKGLTGDWPAFSILLPWRSEGKLAQFDLSNIQPFANLLGRPLEAGKDEDFVQYLAKQFLTGSPLLNLPVAIGTNKDPFSDRNITEQDMTTAEKAMERAKYAWNLMAPPLAGGTGLQQVLAATERSTNKTLEKRNLGQAFMRAVLGLDVRNASPDLYRMAEHYRQEHGLTQDETWAGGTTEQQRQRRHLFAELAQDQPDISNVARILRSLHESGKPVQTQQDINRLLFYRNPLMVIRGQTDQTRFRFGLQGESRAVLEDALAEFHRIQARAPQIIAQARAKMLQSGPVVTKPIQTATR